MHPVTLGPDEDGWTYTLSGRSGLLIGNNDSAHSYVRRGTDAYFTPAQQERPRNIKMIAEDYGDEAVQMTPYDRIIIVRTKCERKWYGRPAEEYIKYKLFMFRDEACFVRKYVHAIE